MNLENETVDIIVRTMYRKEDFDGFAKATSFKESNARNMSKSGRVIYMTLAFFFWIIAAIFAIWAITSGNSNLAISSTAYIIVFIFLGIIFYTKVKPIYNSKASWNIYPYKGEVIEFRFLSGEFIVIRENSEVKIKYQGLEYICEDEKSFYIFESSHSGHMIPKRDITEEQKVQIRQLLENATGMQSEYLNKRAG